MQRCTRFQASQEHTHARRHTSNAGTASQFKVVVKGISTPNYGGSSTDSLTNHQRTVASCAKHCRQPSAARVSGLLLGPPPWGLYTEGVQRWHQRHRLWQVLVVFWGSFALDDLLSMPLLLALLLLQPQLLLLQLVWNLGVRKQETPSAGIKTRAQHQSKTTECRKPNALFFTDSWLHRHPDSNLYTFKLILTFYSWYLATHL